MKQNIRLKLLGTLCGSIALTGGALAEEDKKAAGQNSESFALEEITVFSQKRNESLQDVGLTVTAFTENDLSRLNVSDTAEIAAISPNVQINYGLALNAFNVRGVGSNEFQTNLDAPIAVHVDEIYLSKVFMSTMVLFDLERIEVAKGPQGTLFGRNTTGGAINFYTRKPTEEFEAGLNVGYGNYSTIRTEGFISGPLSDNLSARLSGFVVDQGTGFYDNLTTAETEGRDKKYAVRAQLLWTGEDTDVLLSFHYGEDSSELPPYEGEGIYTPESYAAFNSGGGFANIGLLTPCQAYLDGTVTGASTGCVRGNDGGIPGDDDPFTSTGHRPHDVNNTSYGGALRINKSLENIDLTFISSVEYFERDQEEVGDGSATFDGTWLFWYSDITQYSQEIRLTSTGDDRWKYILGAYYEHDDFSNGDYLTFGAGDLPALGGLFTEFTQKVDAIAVFLHNEIEVSDRLNLIAGMRYNRETTSIDGGTCFGAGIMGDKIQQPATGCLAVLSHSDDIPEGNSRTDENVSFKVGFEWTPELSSESIEDLMVYGNVSTGFRSGGFNAGFADRQAAFTTLAPEEITSYEIGFKSMLANNRLRINGAFFRYDFRDGHINVDNAASIIPITINAAQIETWGAELETEWMLSEGLTLRNSFGWLNATIKSDLDSAGIPLQGNRPINSPEFTYTGLADYEFPIGNDFIGYVGINASWRAEQFLETNNKPANRQAAYWLVGARASFGPEDGSWEASLWVKNLTNTEYITYVNDLFSFGWTLNTYGPPRTWGGAVKVRF